MTFWLDSCRHYLISVAIISTIALGNNIVFAADTTDDYSQDNSVEVEETEDYIFQLLEDYKNGTFVERNDDPAFNTAEMLDKIQPMTLNTTDEMVVDCIYDNRKISEDTYAATRITIATDLETSSSDKGNNVAIRCTLIYNRADFDDWYDYIMLVRTKGTVLEERGTYESTKMTIKYQVYGDAYDKSGNRYGFKGKSDRKEINNPMIGASYVLSGPSDYYYNMGAKSSYVQGDVEVEIKNSAGDVDYLNAGCEFTPV